VEAQDQLWDIQEHLAPVKIKQLKLSIEDDPKVGKL
jgi:hypothetical protein